MTMTSRRGRGGGTGFTVLELIVFLALAGIVAASLHHALVSQQRFYRHQRSIAIRHDALRLAGSLVTSDVRAANPAEGDLADLASDSLSVRSAVGFGIICAVDTATATIGLFDVHGRISASAGDSLLIYAPDGWRTRAPTVVDPSDGPAACAHGAPLETSVRVDDAVTGVPVGAPVQAFHSRTYVLHQEADRWWLAWSGDTAPEVLAGPFSAEGSGIAFEYLDSLGTATADPAEVARVNVTLIAEPQAGSARHDTLRASVSPRNR